jgi:hypothetical protein
MKKIILSAFLTFAFIITASPIYAQELEGIKNRPLENSRCVYEAGETVIEDENGVEVVTEKILTIDCIPVIIINLIFWGLTFVGIVALFLIIFSGIKFITSGGDPKAVETARKTATWAIIGLVVILLSFAIVRLVSDITGVECLRRIGFMVCEQTPR